MLDKTKKTFFMVASCFAAAFTASCGGGGVNLPPLNPPRIAFFSDRTGDSEVWVMDTTGGNLINLTNDPNADDGHTWHELGIAIAFVSNRSGNWDVYTVNSNGTGLQQRTNDPAPEGEVDWSPNGQFLVYAKNSMIVRYDFASSTETPIVATGTTSTEPMVSPNNAEVVLTWSPTGVDFEIAKVPATGGTPVNLTNDPINSDRSPVWSPNGQQIAWVKNGNIWVMDANGTNQVQLTTSGNAGWPAFSPNGQYLAYVDNGDIWRLTWSGSAWTSPVQLTTNGVSFTPCWTSTSTQIAYMSTVSGDGEIWIMRFDGTQQTNLTNIGAVDENPQCSP
jgi:Tol biopolymer transport system component